MVVCFSSMVRANQWFGARIILEFVRSVCQMAHWPEGGNDLARGVNVCA